MSNRVFNALDGILFGNKRPWLVANHSDEKFMQLTSQLPKTDPPFQLKFNIECADPFNGKSIYFKALIDNGKVMALNEINKVLTDRKTSGSQLEKSYHSIKEGLHFRIEIASRALSSVRLGFVTLDKENLGALANSVMTTNCYILEYLRLSLIQMSAELKSHFNDVVSDIMFATGFLQGPDHGFHDSLMADGGHIAADAMEVRVDSLHGTDSVQLSKPTRFVPIMDDIRSQKDGIVPYKEMVKNPVMFGWVEENLHMDKLIDGKYSFCGRHGCKNKLTAIYHFLIEKRYFNHINDATGEKITPLDIVRFLDYRYGLDLETQFHLMKKEVDKRARLINSADWLRNLPECHN